MDISDLLSMLQHKAEQNLLDIEEAKSIGTKVVGFYCLYSPVELAVAAGAITVSLCGTSNDPVNAAEEYLPRNLCPLIKSSFGFAVTDTCPFFRFSDLIIGDTTCDGKKKMFELMARIKPVHVIQLPQNQDQELALPFFISEVKKAKKVIEEAFDTKITDEKLANAIRLMNRERRAFKELMDLGRMKPSPISGLDILTIRHKTAFFADKNKEIELLHHIVSEVNQRASSAESSVGRPGPRILLTGTPVGVGSDKLVKIMEKAGASVVVAENCSGYKRTFTIDENKDPILALSEQYLQIPCSVMSPNTNRFNLLSELIEAFQADGVVDLTWHACHTYNIESHFVESLAKEKYTIPFLHIETDYSESDIEQLRVRVEAFLEIVQNNSR